MSKSFFNNKTVIFQLNENAGAPVNTSFPVFCINNLKAQAALIAGVWLIHVFQVTTTLACLVRVASMLENNIVAVERIKEYAELQTEVNYQLLLLIAHVNECPTMHYFGNPKHTQSMIANMTLTWVFLEIPVINCIVVNMPYYVPLFRNST